MFVYLHGSRGWGEVVDALGKLGLSYGVGMVVGPVLGGQFTKHLG